MPQSIIDGIETEQNLILRNVRVEYDALIKASRSSHSKKSNLVQKHSAGNQEFQVKVNHAFNQN